MSASKRALIIILCGICVLLGVWYFMQTKDNKPLRTAQNATVFKIRRKLKPFTLTDTNGKKFTLQSMRGHWNLVFFGYATCPDICPQTLGVIRDTWNLYTPPYKVPSRFIFANITPLPDGDTTLKEFLGNYNQEFIGISGSKEAMDQLGDQLGIYANQQPGKIDHTAALLLIDPQGKLSAVLTPPFDPIILANDLNLLTRG